MKLIIKSEKVTVFAVCLYFLCVTAFSLFLLFEDVFNSVFISLGFIFVLYFMGLRYCIAVCRTLIMDEEGCTVKFLCFQKKYKWVDMKTKRIEDYGKGSGWVVPFEKAVVFSLKKRKRPKRMQPIDYCILFHPFDHICVYFKCETKELWAHMPVYYLIDEQEFMTKMNEWKVFTQGDC